MARRIRAAIAVGALTIAAVSMSLVTTAGAETPGATREGTSAQPSYEKSIAVAIDDIQDYWSDTFPAIFGARYQPVPANHIIAGRPGVKLPSCQGQKLSYRDVSGNAFYCYGDNFVAYDGTKLFRDLHSNIGPFAVALGGVAAGRP